MTTTKITAKAAALLDELRDRRTAHAAHRQLQRELSTYTRPAEINDLLAALADHTDTESAEVRSILHHNLAAYHQAAGSPFQRGLGDFPRVRVAS